MNRLTYTDNIILCLFIEVFEFYVSGDAEESHDAGEGNVACLGFISFHFDVHTHYFIRNWFIRNEYLGQKTKNL